MRTFLRQMQAVRTFFAPWIDGKMGVPDYKVQVAFRVNQPYERGAEQILDWRLRVGDQLLRYRGQSSPHQGHWRFGDPIQLSLRWAKDAPSRPLPDRVRDGGVEDHTVVYTGTSRWSLLRFLRRHGCYAGSPCEADPCQDPDPHTLGFTIPTEMAKGHGASPTGVPSGAAPAEVFIRMRMVSAGQPEPLVLPCFPTQAPPLPRILQNGAIIR